MDKITNPKDLDRPSTKSIAKSKVFTFIVGPDKTEFTIHAALVAKQSPVLNVLVNGPFKEALEQRVEWIDLQEDVFLSFWEFAYTGNYTNTVQENGYEEDRDPAEEELSHWGKFWANYVRLHSGVSGTNSRDTPRLNRLWQVFVYKYAPISQPPDAENIGADTLLHHAQVCVFADRYCIDKLMDVAMDKLFIALEATIPWGYSWDPVMELLVMASGKFVPMKLRQMVAGYILSQAELFKNEESFQHFIARERGEFTDFPFACEGQTINVHKIIICSQSTVFHRACTGKLKVQFATKHTFMSANKAQEASSGTYDINDHPLDAVNRMVEYFYTGTYEIPEDADLFTHASMFTLADKYGIGGLQALASKYLECLDESCNWHDFARSISQVYELPRETSKTLRVGALMMAREHLGTALTAIQLGNVIDEFL
ncbi:hypothetical protein F25303_5847 [Fusarium sp. NRRL 25303]|nr:hypothetical protein F25303_5847 [Fusarium sp. NRRL 25303]